MKNWAIVSIFTLFLLLCGYRFTESLNELKTEIYFLQAQVSDSLCVDVFTEGEES